VTVPLAEHEELDVQVVPLLAVAHLTCHAVVLNFDPLGGTRGGAAVLHDMATQVLVPDTHVPLLLHVADSRPTPPVHAAAEHFAPAMVVRQGVCHSLPLTPTPAGKRGKMDAGGAVLHVAAIMMQNGSQQQQQQQAKMMNTDSW
jgi:hypothetical protein